MKRADGVYLDETTSWGRWYWTYKVIINDVIHVPVRYDDGATRVWATKKAAINNATKTANAMGLRLTVPSTGRRL